MKLSSVLTLTLLATLLISSCAQNGKIAGNKERKQTSLQTAKTSVQPKYSLAQWSYNRELFAGEMNTVDFIQSAAEMDFAAVEYVSQFFQDKVQDFAYLERLNAAAKAAGIKNLMIQVDNIGNLGASDPLERSKAIEEAKKWVDAASYLNCDMMRVNAHGDGSPQMIKANSILAITELAQYANTKNIQIVIENHGGISNDGAWLADLVASLESVNVASLADFHNWCIERENGQLWGAPCVKMYDYYQGFSQIIGTAKGVSVKAFAFDAKGNETEMNFPRFFQLIKAAAYDGYLGIEYEGIDLPSKEGILKTKLLAEKSWNAVH